MTFSILARDPATGQLGVASTTHAFGVGIVADHARPGVGAIATQAFVEVGYGPKGLDLLALGVPPDVALSDLVEADPHRAIRQVAFLDAAGGVSAFTGEACIPSAGHMVGNSAVVLGNMLANDEVLPATLHGYQTATGSLAERLLAALESGQRAGGDVRGQMSAAIRVVTAESHSAEPWHGTVMDLRVDVSPRPLQDLRTSLRTSDAYRIFFESVFAPGLVTGSEPIRGEALQAALDGLEATQAALGPDLEPTLWQGVLLLRAGNLADARSKFAAAVQARQEFYRFIDGLHEAGIIAIGAQQILNAPDTATKPAQPDQEGSA